MDQQPSSSASFSLPDGLNFTTEPIQDDSAVAEALLGVFDALPPLFRTRKPRYRGTVHVSQGQLSKLITVTDMKLAELRGTGGFGEIWLLTHRTIGRVALKRLQVAGSLTDIEEKRRRTLREGNVWRGLQHSNVLPFMGVLETSDGLYLASPFVENGSLADYIKEDPDVDRPRLLLETAAAIAYLHRSGIVHGDIKASNVLISDDIHALVCDFGLARSVQEATSAGLRGHGSIPWQSPELLDEGTGKTFASDTWAFGMTIYETLSGHFPYSEYKTLTGMITAILVKDQRPPSLPTHSPTGDSYSSLWAISAACCQKEPSRRLSMEETLERLFHQVVRSLSLVGHQGWVESVAFSPDGGTVASGSFDRTVRLWEARSGASKGKALEGYGDWSRCLGFSPDGRTVASATTGGAVMLWDAESGAPRPGRLVGHSCSVRCLAFSRDATLIASGDMEGTIRVWNPESGQEMGTPLVGHAEAVRCIAFSPDGSTIASASSDFTVRLWNVAAPGTPATITLAGHAGDVRSLAFSPNGNIIASGSEDATVWLWDVESGMRRGEPLKGHKRAVRCVAFSPDGKLIASGGGDFTIRLWDVESGKQKGEVLTGHADWVTCLAFSPDGRTIVSGSDDDTVRLWAVDTT